MPEFENLPPELTGFEASLSRLTPAASRIDRDRLMFRLGQESRRGGRLKMLWPAATVALAILSGGLGFRLAADDGPGIVYVEPEIPASEAQAPRTWYSPELAALNVRLMTAPELRIRSFTETAKQSAAQGKESLSPRNSVPARMAPRLRIGDRHTWREWLEDGV